MEIQGIITEVLGVREGVSASGNPWRMQDFVLRTQEFYPKSIVFTVSDGQNGRIERLNISVGKKMTIFFDIDAHEYNGRWFNSIRAYDAREVE